MGVFTTRILYLIFTCYAYLLVRHFLKNYVHMKATFAVPKLYLALIPN